MVNRNRHPNYGARNAACAITLAVLCAGGCLDDVDLGGWVGTGGTTGGGTGGGESTSESGVDESGGDGSGGGDGGGGGEPCGYPGMLGSYELEQVPTGNQDGFHHLQFAPSVQNPGDDCNFAGLVYDPAGTPDPWALAADGLPSFEVFVYHPQDATGAWPSGVDQRPVVFFAPGNGLELVNNTGATEADHYYLDKIRALVEEGFVVFAIQPLNNQMSTRRRRAALACTMLWARDEWVPDFGGNDAVANPLSDFMVLAGHSRGGSGAYLLTGNFITGEHLPTGTSLDDWQQCATTTFAQNFSDNADAYVEPNPDPSTPPFLTMQGTIDEDTQTETITSFDNRVPESQEATGGAAVRDETAVVVHGQSHRTWGGAGGTENSEFGPFYLLEFLHWQMMGDDAGRRRFMDLTDFGVDPCAFDDLTFSDPSDWAGINQVYYEGCAGATPPTICTDQGSGDPQEYLVGLQRPLVYADFTQGSGWEGASRFLVDSMDWPNADCAIFGSAEQNGNEYTVELAGSSSGGSVRVTTEAASAPSDEDGPCVCNGEPDLLNAIDIGSQSGTPDACDAPGTVFGSPQFNAHEGNGLLVRFGEGFGPATIRWSLVAAEEEGGATLDISEYTHLSVRVANMVLDEDASCVVQDPFAALADDPDEFDVVAYLEDADGDDEAHALSLGVQVESVVARGGPGGVCRSAQFMHTIRVPLREYCAGGRVATQLATAIALEFDDPDREHVALIDSIELVADPNGAAQSPTYAAGTCGSVPDPPPACPDAPPAGFDCEAASSLVATETVCSNEPVNGICDPADVVASSIDLPVVDEGLAGAYDGWVVHVPTGWVADPSDPSPDELDDILGRCVDACVQEYSDQAFVSANCAVENFLEPTLRTAGDRGPVVAIRDADADGSGLFAGQSLTSDLRSDACVAFDEDVCAAAPRRATSAEQAVGRGAEYLLDVAGAVSADSSSAPSTVSSSLSGTLSYSECAAGNATAPCPVYLGSMDLELSESLVLALECNQQTTTYTLSEMEVHLTQPAFGIAEQGTNWVKFPPGALVVEGTGILNGLPFTAYGPIEQEVTAVAGAGYVQLQGIGGSWLSFTAPCGEQVTDVVAWIGFSTTGWPGEPPSVFIDVPSSVSCPSTVSLAHTKYDSENDIESLRWLVDGILLEESMTTVDFTGPHELTAIVRDSRGATTTKSKTIDCL